ncbi:MAG: VWA domain-containing protein [Acidobacteria bacterium]|nr:VWA domain-containing protein [Acidobacteriota bacterium]
MKKSSAFKSSAALLVLALVYAASPLPAAAQSSEKPKPFGASLKRPKAEAAGEDSPPPEEVVKVDTSLVNLDVLVTDAKGSRYVEGLTKDDFVLTEDGRPQTISNVFVGDDAERLPRSIILVLDRSQSELPYLEASVEAAKTLVNQLAPSDEMAVVTDDVELAAGFTKDKKRLRQTLDSLKKLTFDGYRTHSRQFSALLAVLRELIDGETRRPIIIFQTDGDEVSRLDGTSGQNGPAEYDMETVYSEVEKSRAKIYTVIPNVRLIGVPEEELGRRFTQSLERSKLAREKHQDMWFGMKRVPEEKEKKSSAAPQGFPPSFPLGSIDFSKILERRVAEAVKEQTAAARVADLTGGWTSFLEEPGQAGEIYGRILADINHRYVITYYPTNQAQDGKLRRVHVEVRGHPDYVVQGRTSYYATTR